MTKLIKTLSAFIITLPTVTTVFATSFQLVPMDARPKTDKTDVVYLGASIHLNFPHASMSGLEKATGHYGFGMQVGKLFYLNHNNALGAEVNINTSAPSVFGYNDKQLIKASLHDVNVLTKYQHAITNQLSLGFLGGIGFVYGWVSNSALGFYSRLEPIVGSEIAWHLNAQVSLQVRYQHSFGVAASQAYQARQAAPSIDRFSLGVRYAF